ncbi:uncharacterized protein LOC116949523 [Petromyzon marinus]|uniref:uncharacterized protein LOC116949523 n=1 Tax=Petromyzon marinus TaxID=7757 RepID=UPI003F6ECCA6
MDSTRVYVSLGMTDSYEPRSRRKLMSRRNTRRTFYLLALLGTGMVVWLVCGLGSPSGLYDRLGTAWRFGKTVDGGSAQADDGSDVADAGNRWKEIRGGGGLEQVSDEDDGIGSLGKDDAEDQREPSKRGDGRERRGVVKSSDVSRSPQIGHRDVLKKSNQAARLAKHASAQVQSKDSSAEADRAARDGGRKRINAHLLGGGELIDANKNVDHGKSTPVKESAAKPFEYGGEKIGVRFKVPGGKRKEVKEYAVNTDHGTDARKANPAQKADGRGEAIPAQAQGSKDRAVSNELLKEQLQRLKTDLKKALTQKQQDKEQKAKSKRRRSKSNEHPVPIVYVPQKGEDPYRDLSEDLAKLVASVQQRREQETLPRPRRHHSYL